MYSPYMQTPQNPQQIYGMKWFKFLIYFSLFFGALLNLSTAMQFSNGTIYLTQGLEQYQIDFLYLRYPNLQTLDKASSVFYACFAIYAIIVRFQLAKYRRNGPSMVLSIPVIGVLLHFAHEAISAIILSVSFSELLPSFLISVICSGIYFWLNYIYFRKRSHLFTN